MFNYNKKKREYREVVSCKMNLLISFFECFHCILNMDSTTPRPKEYHLKIIQIMLGNIGYYY